jgi:hypothetical protein
MRVGARTLVILAGLCLLGLFSTEVADTDFWWHLKTGEYVVEKRALPSPDPFSYTADLGRPAYAGEEKVRRFNLTHEWLAQALWYLIWRAGGFPAVVLWKALLLASFCGLGGRIAARRTGSWWWGLAAAAATASVAHWFSADRPALVSFVLVAAFVWILERERPLWLLPVLEVVWANSHGGFVLGWVVVGAYTLVAPRKLWRLAALTVAVSALNPNHVRIFEVLLAYRQSTLQQTLVEWSRPPLWGPPYGFPVLLWGAAAVLAIGWRKVQRSDWILFALFAAAALTAFRNIVLVAFLGPVLLASYWPWRRPLPALAAPLTAAALALALGVGVWQGRFFQLRAALWRFPEGAAQFLLAHRISGPMFNTYEYGGYLLWRLWPHQRSFIDGRALNESVYQDYQKVIAEGREARQAVLSRYGAEVLVLNAFEYTTGVVYPLVVALADRTETAWSLVYQDPQALVFLRRPPPGMPVLDRSHVVAHLEAECRLHIERDPELCLCARTLGLLFLNAGDRRRAQGSLALYLASPHEPDPEAEAAYRRLLR